MSVNTPPFLSTICLRVERGTLVRTTSLGSTAIVTPQNAFGALPIQRVSEQDAVALVRRAFEGGMTFFDTARA